MLHCKTVLLEDFAQVAANASALSTFKVMGQASYDVQQIACFRPIFQPQYLKLAAGSSGHSPTTGRGDIRTAPTQQPPHLHPFSHFLTSPNDIITP